MLGLSWSGLLKGLAAILCALGVVSLALIYFFPAPPSKIAIASGLKGGAFDNLPNATGRGSHAFMSRWTYAPPQAQLITSSL